MDDAHGATGRSGEGELRAHPMIAKLVEAIENGEGVVELRGFIGRARESDDAVPLYASLELTERACLFPRTQSFTSRILNPNEGTRSQ